jgi:hypothetical protein
MEKEDLIKRTVQVLVRGYHLNSFTLVKVPTWDSLLDLVNVVTLVFPLLTTTAFVSKNILKGLEL